MDFLNDIDEETIILCSNDAKNSILSLHLLKPIKFMNLKEFRSNFYFSYDEKAILFLMDNYHLKYENALEYIENMYYVKNKHYGIAKLDILVEMYNKLVENNLLYFNHEFREYLKDIHIIVYDLLVDKLLFTMLEGLNYQVIDREYHNYMHNVYEFDNMIQEIRYVANRIANLISNGIDIKKIKLLNVTEEYYHMISWIFNLYGLKVNIPSKSKLTCYNVVRTFLSGLDDISNVPSLLDKVACDSLVYQELFKVVNENYHYDNLELLKYKINNSYLVSPKYDNAIEIVSYLDYISSSDEYFFMLNFNDSVIPKTILDTEYITDDIRLDTYLDTTKVINKRIYDRTVKCIADIKNLEITYKLNDFSDSYYPSWLCKLYNVNTYEFDNTVSYSSTFDKIRLIDSYDNYFKYGVINNDLAILRHNYQVKYNSYDNKFTGINRKYNGLTLSYTNMNVYNKCAFKYYLSYILKIKPYEETFQMLIGNTVHYVMENCLKNNDMDYQKYICEYLKDRSLSNKEKFFLNKYTKAIQNLLEEVNREREVSSLEHEIYEKNVTIDYGDNTIFTGKIDKIMYHTDGDDTYLAMVDYKTGRDTISLNYLHEGIDIQLPIYMFLVKHLDFKNIKYVGFYLQKLNLTDDDYRLEGYSNSDTDILSYIDKEYANSKIIKGLKVKNDGSFYANSKVLSSSEIDDVNNIVQEIIEKVISKIKNNCFDINPKVDNNRQIGCEYCIFNDICFHTEHDNVNISSQNMGGEEV